jgi:hypothetical protein
MTTKAKTGIGGILTGILSNPLTRTVARPILEAVLPKARQAIGRRPLLLIGGASAAAAGALQGLRVGGYKIPEQVAGPLGIGVMLLGALAGQAAVTPVAAPKLTAAQAARAIITTGRKK